MTFEQGDIISVDFDPQSSHEQGGRRPAIVVTNNLFNAKCSLAMVCPITNIDKNHPFHIKLSLYEGLITTGVVLCDQARMLDLTSRKAVFKEKAPDALIIEVVDMITRFVEVS